MFITHELLTTPHGFFGRKGGVSTGVYSSLNCRSARANQAECTENRRRVCTALGGDLAKLRILNQQHTNKVITLSDTLPLPDTLTGDALVTNLPGLILGVVTADCAPVLLADKHAGVIAAVHSGWRGTAGGIVGNAVKAMLALGAQAKNIHAVIGPCIAQASYEVGEDVKLGCGPEAVRFFSPNAKAGHYQFNLPGLVLAQLHSAGIERAHWTGHDTYKLEQDYFSCRRAAHKGEPDFGLQLSVISLTN